MFYQIKNQDFIFYYLSLSIIIINIIMKIIQINILYDIPIHKYYYTHIIIIIK